MFCHKVLLVKAAILQLLRSPRIKVLSLSAVLLVGARLKESSAIIRPIILDMVGKELSLDFSRLLA
jgi:hypothetical protein